MHAHGVPDFPAPQVSEHGGSTSIKMAVPAGVGRNPRFKAASRACRKLLPGGGPASEAPLTPSEQEQYLRAAACIRTHGVPNFPDPTFSGGGVHIDHQHLKLAGVQGRGARLRIADPRGRARRLRAQRAGGAGAVRGRIDFEDPALDSRGFLLAMSSLCAAK